MDLSLSKLPWYGQIGAFVVVAGLAVFGFWHFYVTEMQADIDIRQSRLNTLRNDVARGLATARRLPEFQAQVTELEHRLDGLKAVSNSLGGTVNDVIVPGLEAHGIPAKAAWGRALEALNASRTLS